MNDHVYKNLYELTAEGLECLERICRGELDEQSVDLTDLRYSRPVEGTTRFKATGFATARDMAEAIVRSLNGRPLQEVVGNEGLWGWLTLALIDTLFPKGPGGRKFGEVHRWYPSPPGDWQKAQRHLVRMPVVLFATLGEDAEHLLCNKPSVLPEIREQLTSQQDMFSPNFQRACKSLYFDKATGTLKRGAGGKSRGTPRRMAKLRQQLDVTWDMLDLPEDQIINLLPAEFDRFK